MTKHDGYQVIGPVVGGIIVSGEFNPIQSNLDFHVMSTVTFYLICLVSRNNLVGVGYFGCLPS
jgi:hypothetical protein